MNIAIVDVIGLEYNGDTLNERGLGGSESAIILISKELVKLGFNVTVFNSCTKPAVYDGVKYVDLTALDNKNEYKDFDILISSRTVIPFLPREYWKEYSDKGFKPERYFQLATTAKHKVIWLHDTFCNGDNLLEYLVVNKHIDEIFTLSDFHTSYITNCNHGKRRMFEVLRDKLFITRNGATKYFNEIDISKKDPFLYVFNASVTKGMLPLVNDIWPLVKKQIPQAKLKVIGGYYRFRENANPDAQEVTWRELIKKPEYKTLDIDFLGIITQKQIAEILSSASFTIYPCEFPETYGISSLESLLYNTPVITNRFGALGEVVPDITSYHVDYPITSNVLFPDINKKEQVQKFVSTVVQASRDRYLHQQKMYACNQVKDIATWDTIALQWKQHFFKKLNHYLSVEEYRKVSQINHRVNTVFSRRFTNTESNYIPRNTQQRILVITPVYNAEQYIERCIESVITQDYDNYSMVIIDDCSTDNTYEIITNLSKNNDKIIVIKNDTNKGALYNQVSSILKYSEENDIIILLDGDDALINKNDIFHFYNNLYDDSVEFTYGSCWSEVDNIPLIAQPYPEKVKKKKQYRKHKFNWGIPYTHLRTFKAGLMSDLDENLFKDETGEWYKAGGDGALFYALIEKAEPNKIKAVSDIVYLYNDKNPLNDYKINNDEQTKNAQSILTKETNTMKKRILIAIPTNRYIEPETFKAIYDLEVPEGYETTFQYFHGYQTDQVRNLISHWANNFDYLFCVDSDISFDSDTLLRLLTHDVDVVTGLYIQRIQNTHELELFKDGRRLKYDEVKGAGLLEVGSCGFGCVLVNCDVIRAMEYPHFVYKSAINHADTISEDVYFCNKAREHGFKIWADTSILCRHKGTWIYEV